MELFPEDYDPPTEKWIEWLLKQVATMDVEDLARIGDHDSYIKKELGRVKEKAHEKI